MTTSNILDGFMKVILVQHTEKWQINVGLETTLNS